MLRKRKSEARARNERIQQQACDDARSESCEPGKLRVADGDHNWDYFCSTLLASFSWLKADDGAGGRDEEIHLLMVLAAW